jgi:hypothetical protein
VLKKITGLARSHIHKDPKHELDVQALITSHKKHKMHEVVPERELPSVNKPKDYMRAGVLSIRDKKVLCEYHAKREVYFKAASSKQQYNNDTTPPPSPKVPPAMRPPSPPPSPHISLWRLAEWDEYLVLVRYNTCTLPSFECNMLNLSERGGKLVDNRGVYSGLHSALWTPRRLL